MKMTRFALASKCGGFGSSGVFSRGREGLVADRVKEQALPAGVLGEARNDGGGEVISVVVRVERDAAVIGEHRNIERSVLCGGDLDDVVNPARSEFQDPRRQVTVGVLEHVVGSGCPSEISLVVAADGRDHRGARPHGQLNGSVPYGARPTLHEHHPVVEGTRR